jgi:hypothetical protein
MSTERWWRHDGFNRGLTRFGSPSSIIRMKSIWRIAILWLALVGVVAAVNPEDSFKEKTWDKLSSREESDWGSMALAMSPSKWQHGETDHFIIHYGRNGEKIGRRSEIFYAEIREFFGNRPDLLGTHKSQIFAFQDPGEWKQFAEKIKCPWAGGVTRGDEFFYQGTTEEGRFDSKGKVQAHEITHLIFNRLFQGRPPLWLNEGIAEYFGQRKTSTLTQFRQQMSQTPPYDLDALFHAVQYPANTAQIQAFYAEAAIIVDFLTHTSERAALLPKFVDAVIADREVTDAVKIYGYKDLAEFEAAYKRYRKHF